MSNDDSSRSSPDPANPNDVMYHIFLELRRTNDNDDRRLEILSNIQNEISQMRQTTGRSLWIDIGCNIMSNIITLFILFLLTCGFDGCANAIRSASMAMHRYIRFRINGGLVENAPGLPVISDTLIDLRDRVIPDTLSDDEPPDRQEEVCCNCNGACSCFSNLLPTSFRARVRRRGDDEEYSVLFDRKDD